jgi:hypothetical protein
MDIIVCVNLISSRLLRLARVLWLMQLEMLLLLL